MKICISRGNEKKRIRKKKILLMLKRFTLCLDTKLGEKIKKREERERKKGKGRGGEKKKSLYCLYRKEGKGKERNFIFLQIFYCIERFRC